MNLFWPRIFLMWILPVSICTASDFEQSLAAIQEAVKEKKQAGLLRGRAPTEAEREKLEIRFPKLKGKDFTVTGECTLQYNCIAASVGITDQSIWPGREADFDAFYEKYGCRPAPAGTPFEKADVVLWAKNGEPTHACRRIENGKFESKCGTLEKIDHSLYDIESHSYGKPYKSYLCGGMLTPPRDS